MRMRIFKRLNKPLTLETAYHVSELEEPPPEGMVLVSVVEHEDPLQCAEMVDEAIDQDLDIVLEALSLNIGIPHIDPEGLEIDVEVVRKKGG